jgi:hypothetical protein
VAAAAAAAARGDRHESRASDATHATRSVAFHSLLASSRPALRTSTGRPYRTCISQSHLHVTPATLLLALSV